MKGRTAMPPMPILDLAQLDTDRVIASHEEIYQLNPHRFEFALLDRFCYLDPEPMTMAAIVEVQPDAYWVRGHIPGRPLMPGVLMIESSAQMISYFVKRVRQVDGFIGFGGVTDVKFRGQVTPGDTLILLGKMLEIRNNRRAVGQTQGFVDGKMVYEGIITGMVF